MKGLKISGHSVEMNEWGCLIWALPWLIGAVFMVYAVATALYWVVATFIRGITA